ncbi:hypothetical protein M2323_004613 [Rhodoblastus acidophilus]|uniref:hypothetical protein n=1 Tax=Rhodoblastus acidophilus TaxID=1074 RepID=UPI002224FB5B|nr:hypothetical protein [Rhodoblastus acidophilus]MCW2286808.1 hypothetical protein [Rhodoblastus acidophilus]MCW2335661.1 hypothetical protein [Rhodoblastus acidophilus]
MQDNRGPRIRFFDDLGDIQRSAYIADALVSEGLDVSRAVNIDGETYTFHFQKDGIEALLFAVRDLYDRAYRLANAASPSPSSPPRASPAS